MTDRSMSSADSYPWAGWGWWCCIELLSVISTSEQWFLTQLHITITITCQSFKKWRYSDSTLHLWNQDHVGVWLRHVYFYKALWIFRCSSRVENCNLGVNLSTWWLAGGPWWGGGPRLEAWTLSTRTSGERQGRFHKHKVTKEDMEKNPDDLSISQFWQTTWEYYYQDLIKH